MTALPQSGNDEHDPAWLLSRADALMHVDPTGAIDLATIALRLAEASGDAVNAVGALGILGSCNAMRGAYDEAIDSFGRAYDLCIQADIVTRQPVMLTNIGNVHYYRGDFSAALEYFQRSREFCERTGNRGHLPFLLNSLGNTCRSMGEHAAALTYLQQGLDAIELPRGKRLQADLLHNIGAVQMAQGKLSDALSSHTQALEIFGSLNNRHGMANVRNSLGHLYYMLGQYDAAIDNFQGCLDHSEALGNRQLVAYALNNIGDVHARLGDRGSAIRCYDASLKVKRELDNRRDIVSTLTNLAALHRELGEADAALDNCRSAQEIADALGDDGLRALAVCELAELHAASGEIESALDAFEQALCLLRSGEDREKLALVLVRFGECLASTGQCVSALSRMNEAMSIADDLILPPVRKTAHHALAMLYRQQGDDRRALEHFMEYHRIEREIFNDESDRRARNLMAFFELDRARKQREMAAKEAQILQLENEQLARDVEFKQKELVTTAMYLTQRSDLLRRVQHKVRDVARHSGGPDRSVLDDVIQEISTALDGQRAWQSFEQQFQQVHAGYLETLARHYPTLTPTELKVCALVKINLSTKEIAQILNTEPRSIEKYRQRIRKKLGLQQDDNLASVLLGEGGERDEQDKSRDEG